MLLRTSVLFTFTLFVRSVKLKAMLWEKEVENFVNSMVYISIKTQKYLFKIPGPLKQGGH